MASYTITALAKLSGQATTTLRSWERRYGVPTPLRSENGRRMYSAEDADRVVKISELAKRGHAVSELCALPVDALAELLGGVEDHHLARATDGVRREIARLVIERDFVGFRARLSEALVLLPAVDMAEGVLGPILRLIGEEWVEGRLSVYQEHLFSAQIRQILFASVGLYPAGPGSLRVAFSTFPGELHEMGALVAWRVAAAAGAEALYLGPNLPAAELAAAATALGVRAIALSLVHTEDIEQSVADLRALRAATPPTTAIWVGARIHKPALEAAAIDGVMVFDSFRTFERSLETLRREAQLR